MKIDSKEKKKVQVPDEIKEAISEVVAQATVAMANEINALRKELKELRVDFEILKEGGDI